MIDAGVFTSRSIGELDTTIRNLANDGYRIITVICDLGDQYHVVAQKDDLAPLQNAVAWAVRDGMAELK